MVCNFRKYNDFRHKKATLNARIFVDTIYLSFFWEMISYCLL